MNRRNFLKLPALAAAAPLTLGSTEATASRAAAANPNTPIVATVHWPEREPTRQDVIELVRNINRAVADGVLVTLR